MKRFAALLASAFLPVALAGCDGGGASRNPLPTADSHQPQNPGPYGTGAQETRDNEEAVQADSPNDDGKTPDKDDRPSELPQRSP